KRTGPAAQASGAGRKESGTAFPPGGETDEADNGWDDRQHGEREPPELLLVELQTDRLLLLGQDARDQLVAVGDPVERVHRDIDSDLAYAEPVVGQEATIAEDDHARGFHFHAWIFHGAL